MNIAITDGLLLMPPAFDQGLGVWSRGDGTPGSTTYAGATDAALVTGDADFGSCLEIIKTANVQKLRFMSETPILPGAYLRISARIKAVSGNLPSVRIGAWAGRPDRTNLTGVVQTGAPVALTQYGRVMTVSAIVGTGNRTGVDMPWGTGAIYGHFGIDLTGPNGGLVRIESIRIEDVTEVYARKLMDWVDVRDYGAVGDGVTDDRAAFAAADAAAAGRELLVSAGTYYLGGHTTIAAPVRFVGTLSMPMTARLLLLSSYDFPTYAEAFGTEHLGFAKAIQALFSFSDHNVLDLCGRRVEVAEPIDVGALLPDMSSYSNRRVLTNGQIQVLDGPLWATRTVTAQATYSTAQPLTLTNVANVANIEVGSRVSGTGVGREIYVKAVNVGAGTLTLSQPLYGGSGTRTYTFDRYRYVLDFSNMAKLDRFAIDNVEFLLNGTASGIMLPPAGEIFQMRDCWINRPRDRVITSIGRACQGMMIDNCQFLSNEQGARAQDRTSICFNVNANDTKVRDCRFVRFAHFMVANGTGHMLVGNHVFQGDNETNGVRIAGLVLAQPNVQTTITGNYIDNCHIEWTNEYEVNPDYADQYSFGGLTVTGNTFIATGAARWFKWFSIKPYGAGHFVHGLSIQSNVFKTVACNVDRFDSVDTTFATLNFGRMRNILVEGNSFHGVYTVTANPVTWTHNQNTPAMTWVANAAPAFPFGGIARMCESVQIEGPLNNSSNQRIYEAPFVMVEQGTDKKEIRVNFSQAAKGKAILRIRMDQPN